MIRLVVFFTIFLSFVNSTTLDNTSKIPKDYSESLLLLRNNKNIDLAHELLVKSSNSGYLEATYTLGKLYLSSKTKFHNKIRGYNTILEAANKGHDKAQVFIGKCFLYGKVVDKDYDKAMYYFTLASKQKYYDANCYIAYMYANGLGMLANFGRAHIFAKEEYKNGNKLCVKVWNDFNLNKYPKDGGFKFGDYLEPAK